ncbi:hypothetical protein GS16_02930 [Candidatus Liberibacter solanacearum]|uniref:Uncharacterized protein n=1 Tax=Candidatus Liberibacter solanacearum TaxID=556287 RepID=A0A095BFM8_9HYPH|nr:hypothetical protein GS16_02930 [Candidatus Liberibacter solanacearum]KJZ80628.1 hypothetical protein KP07_05500 [Candidatus Liberibacter solanacearum]KJZ81323.1 hypothetical protein DJ66_1213 [Candidatus Liberibacter solanacearum]KQC48780.1 hypothetical protein AP064_04780 [Candidatus Liberibacter solanacearum]
MLISLENLKSCYSSLDNNFSVFCKVCFDFALQIIVPSRECFLEFRRYCFFLSLIKRTKDSLR